LASTRVLRNPRVLIDDLFYRVDELDEQATRAMRRRLAALRERIGSVASRVEALSPLAVLGRGYSVTTDAETGQVLTAAEARLVGRSVRTRLKAGAIVSRVESIEAEPERI
jgi:exodeoxyribonuclease VII large subunit